MIFLTALLAASIGASGPVSKMEEPVHLTKEMIIGISEDIIRSDIAEVDIDPTVFDIPSKPKATKKSALDEVEFVSEADKPRRIGAF